MASYYSPPAGGGVASGGSHLPQLHLLLLLRGSFLSSAPKLYKAMKYGSDQAAKTKGDSVAADLKQFLSKALLAIPGTLL